MLQIEDGTDVRACVASTALVETIFGEKVRALYDLKKKDKAAFSLVSSGAVKMIQALEGVMEVGIGSMFSSEEPTLVVHGVSAPTEEEMDAFCAKYMRSTTSAASSSSSSSSSSSASASSSASVRSGSGSGGGMSGSGSGGGMSGSGGSGGSGSGGGMSAAKSRSRDDSGSGESRSAKRHSPATSSGGSSQGSTGAVRTQRKGHRPSKLSLKRK